MANKKICILSIILLVLSVLVIFQYSKAQRIKNEIQFNEKLIEVSNCFDTSIVKVVPQNFLTEDAELIFVYRNQLCQRIRVIKLKNNTIHVYILSTKKEISDANINLKVVKNQFISLFSDTNNRYKFLEYKSIPISEIERQIILNYKKNFMTNIPKGYEDADIDFYSENVSRLKTWDHIFLFSQGKMYAPVWRFESDFNQYLSLYLLKYFEGMNEAYPDGWDDIMSDYSCTQDGALHELE